MIFFLFLHEKMFWALIGLSTQTVMPKLYSGLVLSNTEYKSTGHWSFVISDLPNVYLINRTFIQENTQYLACNEEGAFFTSDVYKNYSLWSCQKVCDALVYLLDIFFIRFGTKLCRQSIGIPMGTNCYPLVADLFLFCYERDFMKSLSWENQADIIEASDSTSRYLDDLLNIDNIYFGQMVDCIYPTELQLKAPYPSKIYILLSKKDLIN